MKIHEIHEHVWDIFVLKKEHGYILYSKQINASHICLPKRNKLFKQRNENRGFRENMDFDLQNACQSHIFYKNQKRSHCHYGHFAPDDFSQNPDKSSVFAKSDEHDFFTSLGLISGSIFDDLTYFLRQFR